MTLRCGFRLAASTTDCDCLAISAGCVVGSGNRGLTTSTLVERGFSHKDMLVGINGFDGLLGVDSCHGGDDDGLQAFLLQHLVVVFVQAHAVRLEVDFSPLDLGVIGRAGCDQFCARCAVQEM